MSGFSTSIPSPPPGIVDVARFIDSSENPYAALCVSLSLLFVEVERLTPDDMFDVFEDLMKLMHGVQPSKRSGFIRTKK
jgi:hypothetical protein